MFPAELKKHLVNVGTDKGSINGENYEIYITYPHFILNFQELNVTMHITQDSFGEKANVLGQCLLSKPYSKVKDAKSV